MIQFWRQDRGERVVAAAEDLCSSRQPQTLLTCLYSRIDLLSTRFSRYWLCPRTANIHGRTLTGVPSSYCRGQVFMSFRFKQACKPWDAIASDQLLTGPLTGRNTHIKPLDHIGLKTKDSEFLPKSAIENWKDSEFWVNSGILSLLKPMPTGRRRMHLNWKQKARGCNTTTRNLLYNEEITL